MKKILRLTFLILVKETYLLFKNLLGLIYHPYLTLKKIKAKKDLSQAVLIILAIITPFAFAISTSLIYLVLKYLLGFSLPAILGFGLKWLDFLAFSFWLLAFGYLAFWACQVYKANHPYFKGGKSVA